MSRQTGTKRLIGVHPTTLRFLNPRTQLEFQQWYSEIYGGRVARRASLLLTPPWIVACIVLLALGDERDNMLWSRPVTRSSFARIACLVAFLARLIMSLGVIFFKWERRVGSFMRSVILYPSPRGPRRRKMAKYPLIEPCLSSLLIVTFFSSRLVLLPSPCDWGIRFFWHQNLPAQMLMPYMETVIATVLFSLPDLSFAFTQLELRPFICYSCIVVSCMLVSLTRSYSRELCQRQEFCFHNHLQDEAAALQMRMDPFRLSHLEAWFDNKIDNSGRDHDSRVGQVLQPGKEAEYNTGGERVDPNPMLLPSVSEGAEWEIDCSEVHFGRKIAAGGGGQVWQATYNGREVAVKEIFAQMMEHKNLQELAREASFLHALRSPFIVDFYGIAFDVHGLSLYIVEEQCAFSLHDHLERSSQTRDIGLNYLTIAKQVATAIEYCHKQQIAHNDLKPQNILITRDLVAKLCDFGLAKRHGMNKLRSASNGGLSPAIGTPMFMAVGDMP
jgi:tRNA A-37 threonylcarbamoyl transferase component Bud32